MSLSEANLTPTQRDLQQRHVERRLRLASAAVVDRPINLKFKNGIDPSSIQRVDIKTVDNDKENENSIRIKSLENAVESLEVRLAELIHKHSPPENIIVNPEPEPPHYPSIGEITKVVCKFYKVSHADICSHRRAKYVVRARKVAYYLCKLHTLRSYPAIGRMFGNKDHTCPYYAFKNITEKRANSPEFDAELETLSALVAAIPRSAVS